MITAENGYCNCKTSTLSAYCVIFLHSLLVFAYFFFKFFNFWKIPSGIPSECQTVRIQIRPDILSGLICIQTVCKGYQQTALIGKDLRPWWTTTFWEENTDFYFYHTPFIIHFREASFPYQTEQYNSIRGAEADVTLCGLRRAETLHHLGQEPHTE